MQIYKVVVSAFQEIEVNAESEDEAKILAIKTGLDLSSAEWEIKDVTLQYLIGGNND